MDSLLENVAEVSKKYPKLDTKFSYGTAGFRTRADTLETVMFRMGMLAVIRSRAKEGQAIGVVITASHNPIYDNGVKLVDPLGEMLNESWEKYATSLANANDLIGALKDVIHETKVEMCKPGKVFIARDTRPSGLAFTKALMDGIQALGGLYHDYGVLTTPQLHYMVRCHNTQGEYGEATEQGYYKKLSKAFIHLRMLAGKGKAKQIKLDGANGVGALKVKEMANHMKGELPLVIFNEGEVSKLNEKCGADYVKLYQCAPDNMTICPGDKCVTYDGDADRVMYFFMGNDSQFHLLDGDRIATLIAGFIKERLDKTNVVLSRGLGMVQTAYANGSSTRYAQDVLKVPVALAKTGVKFVHHRAEQFDIGVYFEANGHGTVLFSKEAVAKIKEVAQKSEKNSEQHRAATELIYLIDLVNQAVGDSISDMLVVESILNAQDWELEDWFNCYTDLCNRQLKVKVKDRTVIKTSDTEEQVIEPQGLQVEISKLVANYSKGRSFARPSGTEDVVRVYAEADSRDAADKLAVEVAQKVFDFAGGVGDRPS
ncbi:predicted protein [Nematostella vectensis]|uniref:Phosphoacetylglucosamine mutase n=1 Tax=Nematostella vectensis TaxID=45351 RepID=A7S2H7_NEMVE|nr:predicted protein [Nematostella vectensis]|eukprot:XP_001634171.1 predicted protein [Nematostella vectensis]